MALRLFNRTIQLSDFWAFSRRRRELELAPTRHRELELAPTRHRELELAPTRHRELELAPTQKIEIMGELNAPWVIQRDFLRDR